MTPHEYREDMDFAAENRRRRRLGLPEVEVPAWPTDEYFAVRYDLHGLALSQPGLTDTDIAAMAKLGVEDAPTIGLQARLMERAAQLLTNARVEVTRAAGTREPGEEG